MTLRRTVRRQPQITDVMLRFTVARDAEEESYVILNATQDILRGNLAY